MTKTKTHRVQWCLTSQYRAYCYINKNWKEWKDVNAKWKVIIQQIFNEGNEIK